MNKLLLSLVTVIVVSGFCDEVVTESSQQVGMRHKHFDSVQPTIEAKAGYFFFASETMRDVYNQGGIDVQLAGAYPVWKGLEIYGSVEYMQKSGHSLSANQSTTIWQIPVNIGLKPVITICKEALWYFTLGPRYFYVHQHNNSSYVPRNKGKSGCGLFVNTGFNFIVWKHLLIDLFGEYSYEKVHFHTSRANVYTTGAQLSAFTFGGGLGYAF